MWQQGIIKICPTVFSALGSILRSSHDNSNTLNIETKAKARTAVYENLNIVRAFLQLTSEIYVTKDYKCVKNIYTEVRLYAFT
jgi:hypothetical protein